MLEFKIIKNKTFKTSTALKNDFKVTFKQAVYMNIATY